MIQKSDPKLRYRHKEEDVFDGGFLSMGVGSLFRTVFVLSGGVCDLSFGCVELRSLFFLVRPLYGAPSQFSKPLHLSSTDG